MSEKHTGFLSSLHKRNKKPVLFVTNSIDGASCSAQNISRYCSKNRDRNRQCAVSADEVYCEMQGLRYATSTTNHSLGMTASGMKKKKKRKGARREERMKEKNYFMLSNSLCDEAFNTRYQVAPIRAKRSYYRAMITREVNELQFFTSANLVIKIYFHSRRHGEISSPYVTDPTFLRNTPERYGISIKR